MSDKPETVIITGSSGLIGSALACRIDRRYNVVGFDRPGAPYPPAEIECIDLDVTSDDSVRDGLRQLRERHGDRIASAVHLAAYYNFSGEPSDLYEKITVQGTGRLLRGLRDFHVGQFVFSSTMLVHAPTEPGRLIDEDSPIDPTWDYPASKVRTEELIRAERGDIPAVFLRIAGVYTDRCNSIPIAHQIQRINERQLTGHVYPADTSRGQAFVHLDDLVDAFARVIERRADLPPEVAILIGEPETVSYEELQRLLGELIHGEKWATYRVPAAVAQAGAWVQDHLPFGPEPFIKPWMIARAADHYELNIARARRLLGWEPRHTLRETLPKMIAALKRNPAGWYRANKLDPPKGLEATQTAVTSG
ncbi:MAG TPA: NAD(P)-dependent oxidoreductase [Fimbriiglobus sp.]|nr:NAD(P)-dependent oxidoreductase [Fimbriiglobus sp.]